MKRGRQKKRHFTARHEAANWMHSHKCMCDSCRVNVTFAIFVTTSACCYVPAALRETHWIAIVGTPCQFPHAHGRCCRAAMASGLLGRCHTLALGFLEMWCASVVCGDSRRRTPSRHALGSGCPRRADRASPTDDGRRICGNIKRQH